MHTKLAADMDRSVGSFLNQVIGYSCDVILRDNLTRLSDWKENMRFQFSSACRPFPSSLLNQYANQGILFRRVLYSNEQPI
jgi:hypothetical protein